MHEIFVRTRRKVRGERFVVQSAGGLGVTSETRGGGEAPEDQSHRDWPRDWRERASSSLENVSRILLRFDDGGDRRKIGGG